MAKLQRILYKHTKHNIPFVKIYNRKLEHPLSLLTINSLDLDFLLAYEPWIRRIAVFTEEHHTFYQLIAQAMGKDFYNRFNFYLNVGSSINIYNEIIAWPFDIINVTLDENLWKTGYGILESWEKMLSIQYQVAENFLFIIQGEIQYVSLFEKEMGLSFIPNNFKATLLNNTSFQIQDKTILNKIWDISRNGEVPVNKQFSEEEQLSISEIMQWGEEP